MRVSPAGTEPEVTAKVGAGEPPAVKSNAYAVPSRPFPGVPEVKTGAAETTRVNGPAVTLPCEFDADTENVKEPDVVGVPAR